MTSIRNILWEALEKAFEESGLPKAHFGAKIGLKHKQHTHELFKKKNATSDKLEEYLSRIGISAVEVIKNHKED